MPEYLNTQLLLKLRFNNNQIRAMESVYNNFGVVTTQKAQMMGFDFQTAQLLKYMFDLASGHITIESPDDLAKHYRKLFGRTRRIGIQDLAISRLQRVPRKCVIGNIPAGKFEMYNSRHYRGIDMMYDVVSVGSSNVEIVTTKKPVLRYGESKVQDGVAEIISNNRDGTVNIRINRDYVRLCNRFIVVASLRRPEFYHYMIEMICIEGTKIYVFAVTMRDSEIPNYKNGTQRVYDYGFIGAEIKKKVTNVASILYKRLHGVYVSTEEGNSEFTSIKRNQEEVEEDILVE